MSEKLVLLKRQKSYPINSRRANRYPNYINNVNQFIYTDNQNILSDNYNTNLFLDDNINTNTNNYDNRNQKNNNRKLFKSVNNAHNKNNQIYFDEGELVRLKNENISLFSSLKKIEEDSKYKDIEINGYKMKLKALLNHIKEKNNMLYQKNNLILQLFEEQEKSPNYRDRGIGRDNLANNLLRISNNQIQKYKNKNTELANKINEQNRFIITERKKFMNYISKIKGDYNRIKADSREKEIKIKNLCNLFKKSRNNISNSINISNNISLDNNNKQANLKKTQFGLQIINNKINNNNYITKNYFMIKNKVINKNDNDYDLMNKLKDLENKNEQNDKIISLKEKTIN